MLTNTRMEEKIWLWIVYIPSFPEIKVHYSIFAGTGDYFVPRFKFYLLIYFLMQHAYYYEMQS